LIFIQRKINDSERNKYEEQLKFLKRKFINKKYIFSSRSPIDEKMQNRILENNGGWSVMLQDLLPIGLILEIRQHLLNKLNKFWLPHFYQSELYRNYHETLKTRVKDVFDDVLNLKYKADKPILMRDRWLYSSQTIISFRKALKNRFTTKMFNQFLELKTPEDTKFTFNILTNNLEFLVEVQKYKEMHQEKKTEKEIVNKAKLIIDAYLKNPLKPEIQIDCDENIVKMTIYNSDFLSPYLFLESELYVFYKLMPLWLQFDQMRSIGDLNVCIKKGKKVNEYSALEATTQSLVQELDRQSANKSKWRSNQYSKILKTQYFL
jgi:hypothetical protein